MKPDIQLPNHLAITILNHKNWMCESPAFVDSDLISIKNVADYLLSQGISHRDIPLPYPLAITILNHIEWANDSPAFMSSDLIGLKKVANYLLPQCIDDVNIKEWEVIYPDINEPSYF